MYSLVAVATVLAVLLLGRPLLAQFPVPALVALIVFAALQLVDIAGFRRLASFRRAELALAVATLAAVVVLGILQGVLLAVALSFVDMLLRVGRPHDAVLGQVLGLAGMHDVDDYPGARTVPGLVVYRYDSPFFFANAENFRRRALRAVDDQTEPVRWFLLNAEERRGRFSPRSTRWTPCVRSCRDVVSSSPWHESSRSCMRSWRPTG
jgi:MFS superfamily sulfate permease-like transporter